MRTPKLAVTFSVLFLSIFGLGTVAKSATLSNTIAAIQSHHHVPSLDDLDDSTQSQVICLALNLYHEDRGGSAAGVKAVAFSTRNRVRLSSSHNFCDVIWEKGQYVWTKRSIAGIMPKEKASWERMVSISRDVVTNADLDDPTQGANSFYSRKITPPRWAHRSRVHLTIGTLVFVKL